MPASLQSSLALVQFWLAQHPILFAALVAWTFIWKGFALWKAARIGQPIWFSALLVLNTFGIFEIIYLVFVARKYRVEAESTTK